MSDITCYYCNERVPPDDYDVHTRQKHAIPAVQDMCRAKENYDMFCAMYHQRRSIPATLHGSGTETSHMSATLAAWQEPNEFAQVGQSTRYITADDVSSFRVDRSDEPRTVARSLQKLIKLDILEFMNGFQGLGRKSREKCNDLVRGLPVFAVRVTFFVSSLVFIFV